MFLRFLIFIGFVLSVGAALGSFSLFNSYQAERELRLEAESSLIQFQDSAAYSKADLKRYQDQTEELQAEVDQLKSDLETQSSLAEEYKTQADERETEINSLNQKILDMKTSMGTSEPMAESEMLETESDLISEPLIQPADDYQMEESFDSNDLLAEPTRDGISEESESFMEEPSAMSKPTSVMTSSTTSSTSSMDLNKSNSNDENSDARILTVNRKFNFVVINLGLKDGLRMGDKVEVIQGDVQKALAQVEKIYDKFSAATLLSEDKGNPVHEGDTIRQI